MTIVDFRVRPPFKGFLDMIMYSNAARRDRITARHGMAPAPSAQSQSMDLLLEEMDAGGVGMGVVTGRYSGVFGSVSNRDLLDLVKAYPQRFVGIPSIDPTDRRAAIQALEAAHASGLVGVNIEPGSYPIPMHVDDRRLYPIYAYCEDRDIPVVIMAGGNAGPDLSYTAPTRIDRIAGDFPRMRIAVSHGGWPWVHQILHVAFRRENLWVSPDQYLCNMAGMDEYIRAANGYLAERFLYASSYPFISTKDYAGWFRTLPIREEVLPRLLYKNAAEFLGLEL